MYIFTFCTAIVNDNAKKMDNTKLQFINKRKNGFLIIIKDFIFVYLGIRTILNFLLTHIFAIFYFSTLHIFLLLAPPAIDFLLTLFLIKNIMRYIFIERFRRLV